MGARIRITSGPWPERIGSEGNIVDQPAAPEGAVYPWPGRAASEVIVLLDHDPLGTHGRTWTCAIGRKNVEII